MSDRIYSEAQVHEERERAVKWAVGLLVLYGKRDLDEWTAGEVQAFVRRSLELLANEPDDESGF